MNNSDYIYMKEALKEAKKAYKIGEVPIGCVIVQNDIIIARGYNKRQTTKNAIMHAEIIAINKACKKLNRWILDDCTIYVTLEPCPMCAGAILQSRMKRVVFATEEPKFGACGSIVNLLKNPSFNHQVSITSGIMQEESKELLQNFFHILRQKGQNRI